MDGSSNSGSGSVAKMLTAVAALVTAAAALIGALAAIGVFDQASGEEGQPSTTPPTQPSTTPPSTAPPNQPSTTPPTTPPPVAPELVDVTLNYTGDPDGCLLPLTFTIGEQTVVPQGGSYTVSNVEVGLQDYSVAGTIQCPTLGSCQATGSGLIDIAAGRQFFVVWQNVAFGQCDVVLQT